MPTVHAVNHCPIAPSFRVCQVAGIFDLPEPTESRVEFDVQIPGPAEPWSIGVIVGPSGSGKTTVARQCFGDALCRAWPWPDNQSLLDAFPPAMGIRDITALLGSVGFSSPPAWLRPFRALSNGEQFRVHLARTLAEMPALAVVDEFTSVVDRTVAQVGAAAVARAVRARNQRFVAVTCHYDVLPWLQPDWILDMADGMLSRGRLQRPAIPLQVIRCSASAWRVFSRHHYLSADLHRSAQCFAALVSDSPAAFVAALPFPHPQRPGWREHRCVCLPDFQGLGIGNALSEFVASLYASLGKPYTSVTSHPAMMRHRLRSPRWRMTRIPSRLAAPRPRAGRMTGMNRASSFRRLTASFQYIGPPRPEEAAHFGIQPPRPA